MNNALLIYESLNDFAGTAALIGKQDDIFLDFKESRTEKGVLLDDDKAHFSKAASGFAHQEGGVLVWGIEAKKGKNDIDEAVALRPIPNLKAFLSGLQDYVKYSTEPVVDGIQSKLIFEKDEASSNKGYAVTLFPKSSSEHRALGNNRSDFYKRHGDSFSPLSTADIRALFFRSLSPDLELVVKPSGSGNLRFSLRNNGKGIAKYPSVDIGWEPNTGGTWYDGEGNQHSKIGVFVHTDNKPYALQFITNSIVVVHFGQEIGILTGPSADGVQRPKVKKIWYRIFAENMVPMEGMLDL